MPPLTQLEHYQSDEYDLWIGHFNDGTLLLDGYVKVPGGLKHLVARPPNTRLFTALHLTLEHGFFSSRPYTVAQGCDGSIDAPAFALYLDFCTRHHLDAAALYHHAYPGDPLPDLAATGLGL